MKKGMIALLVIVFLVGIKYSGIIKTAEEKKAEGFGINGEVVQKVGDNYFFLSAARLMQNGKIVVGGGDSMTMFLARFLNNGKLDFSFGKNGIEKISLSGIRNPRMKDFVVQKDDKIVIVGGEGDYVLSNEGTVFEGSTFLVRYLLDGRLDKSFGNNGIVRYQVDARKQLQDVKIGSDTEFGGLDIVVLDVIQTATYNPVVEPEAVLLQPDGKMVVVSQGEGYLVVERRLQNGAQDLSFTTGIANAYDISGAALQPNGNVIVTGSLDSEPVAFQFSGNGKLLKKQLIGDKNLSLITPPLVQPDGKFVVGVMDDKGDLRLVRYSQNLNPDHSFKDTSLNVESCCDIAQGTYFRGTAVLPDGAMVLGAMSMPMGYEDEIVLIKYQTDGGLDSSFGNNGISKYKSDKREWFTLSALLIQSDNKIIVTGSIHGQVALKRFLPNGEIDASKDAPVEQETFFGRLMKYFFGK